MTVNWDKILDRVLKREGGIADRPLSEDPGGLTNFGITQGFYASKGYKGSVKDLTPESAKAFYLKEIVEEYKLDDRFKTDWLADFMFDTVVHHGPTRAIQFLQIAINCTAGKPTVHVDGRFGPATKKALDALYGQVSVMLNAQFRSALTATRYTYLWTRPHAAYNPGWFSRVLEI